MMTGMGGSPAIAATLRLLLPTRQPRNVGVLLLDLDTGTLHWRFISEWGEYADEEDIEVLKALDREFRDQATLKGGKDFYEYLSDTLSNSLQLVDELDLRVWDFVAETDLLYQRAVEGHAD